jgi:hypothetical protein
MNGFGQLLWLSIMVKHYNQALWSSVLVKRYGQALWSSRSYIMKDEKGTHM